MQSVPVLCLAATRILFDDVTTVRTSANHQFRRKSTEDASTGKWVRDLRANGDMRLLENSVDPDTDLAAGIGLVVRSSGLTARLPLLVAPGALDSLSIEAGIRSSVPALEPPLHPEVEPAVAFGHNHRIFRTLADLLGDRPE